MATPSVLTFDAEGRAVDIEVWVDDLQLFLQCDRADKLSLFDLTSSASPAPPTTGDTTVRSQWATCDAAARLAVRRHLPTTERAHFSQYKSAKTLDHFLSVCPTTVTVDLLEERLLAVEKSIVAVGASCGDPRTPVFERCSPSPLLPSVASAAAADLVGTESVGVVSAPSERRRTGKGKGGKGAKGAGGGGGGGGGGSGGGGGGGGSGGGGGGVGGSSGGGGGGDGGGGSGGGGGGGGDGGGAGGGGSGGAGRGSAQRGGSGGGPRQQQQRSHETPSPQQLREWYAARQRGEGTGPCTYVLRTGDRAGEQCGGPHSTQRCFGRLTDAWRHQFPDATEIPRWGELSRAGVAIFDLDYDAILAAMYAVSASDEGDCYLCVPPDSGIEAAALSTSETAALGASASSAPGAGESALSGTTSAQALHTFTLDSGASRSFFRDRTTLTPLSRPVAVSLADPSGGPVLASFSTVLPCPAAPSGTLSGLYLPSFSTNLVSGADLQDRGVDQFTPASQRVTHCTCARTGRHLATFTRRPGTSLYTLTTESPPVAESGPAPTCIPCVEGQQRAAPHSSEFPPTEAPLQTLHMDVGGEFSSARLGALCCAQIIRQTFTLPASPQKNGIAERRIGMVMDVACTSMIHAAGPHFLWPFAVQYATHQLNLQPRVSLPETSPTLQWTGKVGDASAFRVWGSRSFIRDLSADKLSPRAVPCVFLGFPPNAPGWQFYHPTSHRPPLVDPLPPQGPAPSGVSRVDAVERVEVAIDSGAARGAEPAGAGSGGAQPWGAESGGAEPGGAESGGAEPGGAEPGGAEPGGAGSARVASHGASSRRELLSPQELRESFARRWSRAAGAGGATFGAGPGGATVGATDGTGAAGTGGAAGAVGVGPAGHTAGAGGGTGAAGPTGVGAAGAAGAGDAGGVGAGASEGAGVGAAGARGDADTGAVAGGTGVVPAVSGGVARPRPYFVPLLEQVLGLPPSTGPAPPFEDLAERPEPASRPASPVRAARTSGRAPHPRPPAVPGTHQMALSPSTAPLRVPLPSPPESSLPILADPESDSLRAASPTVTRLLATVVTDPSFESTAASALVAELVDFAARSHVLEDRQEEFQCFAAALPHLVSTLIAPEGDLDAPDIPTPRSYAEAIKGPYSSQWQTAMDAEMAFWKSTGTYVDEVPPPGANIRDYELHSLDFSIAFLQGSLHEEIWLRRPPQFTVSFPLGTQWSLRRPLNGLCQAPREWHDTLRTTLAALGFAPSTANPSLFLSTDTSLPPLYILMYVEDLVFAAADTARLAHVKSELQKRHTCTDLGELRSYLGLQITRDRAQRTITLTLSHMVQQVLQHFDFTYSSPQTTPLSTRHSLSALPSDKSVESIGLYPELVGCLMYLMTYTRPDLADPLSILERYVSLGRHRPEHMAAAKRVLRYLCSTSGMGLVLGGRRRVILTAHWV
ncbi:unnamed protein product [Closterium sp. NIES-65]|nr:unnamed protein product [Closterium sp. NIES-65]